MSSAHRKAGSADLPLHSGRVPSWLASRMAKLGAVTALQFPIFLLKSGINPLIMGAAVCLVGNPDELFRIYAVGCGFQFWRKKPRHLRRG